MLKGVIDLREHTGRFRIRGLRFTGGKIRVIRTVELIHVTNRKENLSETM